MSFNPSTVTNISNQMQADFLDYVNEVYDQDLSEVLADAVNRYLTETYGGQIDPELEIELAVNLIKGLRVVNVSF